jgi:hypothetical protein
MSEEEKKPAGGYVSDYLKRSPRTFEEASKDHAIRQRPDADPERKLDK